LFSAQEAHFGLSLGLARRLVDEPHAFGKEDPWFSTVESRTGICAAAMRTPPYNLILSFFEGDPERTCRVLMPTVAKTFGSIPGVIGQKEIAQPFADLWCETRGVSVRNRMEQTIYELTEVRCEITSDGLFRQAGEKDRDTVAAWTAEFHRDVFGDVPPEDVAVEADAKVDRGEIYLWVDKEPVSMCGSTRPTDHGISVSNVYTPPGKRGRGYATACVASLCKELLGSRYRFCVLYADSTNPTSNEIYKRIGFTEIGDSSELWFDR
jgi:predicted GNAT family acetyltransferase